MLRCLIPQLKDAIILQLQLIKEEHFILQISKQVITRTMNTNKQNSKLFSSFNGAQLPAVISSHMYEI